MSAHGRTNVDSMTPSGLRDSAVGKPNQVRQLHDEASLVDDHSVAVQRVGWLPESWRERWQRDKLPRFDALELVIAEWELHGTIRRTFISGLADPEVLFIASMAWGFGDDARGLHRVSEMLRRERVERPPLEVVADIVTPSRDNGAAAGFSALFLNGRTRVHGLGIAFGTKLIHFAGYNQAPDPQPLILDLNVWRGAQALSPIPPVPDPQRHCTSAAYERYCSWASSAVLDTTPRVIEYTLFQGGRGNWPTN